MNIRCYLSSLLLYCKEREKKSTVDSYFNYFFVTFLFQLTQHEYFLRHEIFFCLIYDDRTHTCAMFCLSSLLLLDLRLGSNFVSS